jgi:two-component system phosphate regulon sensor histidine kinase PhoR
MRGLVRHRQVLLFVIAIVVPSILLVVMAVRMARQERELEAKRLDDERLRRTATIRDALLSTLERARVHATAAFERDPHSPGPSSDVPVALVARIADDHLVLPWDDPAAADAARRAIADGAAGGVIADAERGEFIDHRYHQAAAAYGHASRLAASPLQRVYAQLLRARVLAKAGQTAAARDVYFELLQVPSSIADEHGVPIWAYAAERAWAIAPAAGAAGRVLKKTAAELAAPRWMTPAERYLITGVLDGIVAHGAADEQTLAARLRARLRPSSEVAEQALALQSAFPLQGIDRLRPRPPQLIPAPWILWGEDPWLVSVAGPVLVAVPAGAAVRDAGVRLVAGPSGGGEWLGEAFPGIRVRFPPADDGALTRQWETRRWYSWTVVLLVVTVTASGGYFLWRDVQREVRVAALRAQFVSSVSHELKTPLTAIRMFAETLRMGRAANPQVAEEYLDTIVNEAERLSRLLNNVLEFAKMERGVARFRLVRQPIGPAVGTAVRALSYPLAQQGFELRVDVSADLPELLLDADAIEQAVLNLLTNAMKYSGPSRVIDLTVRRDGGAVVIDVVDRGIGIPVDDQPRVFDKFYRAPTPENHHIPGTGLGLTLVDHIVRGHGGSVRVRSAHGAGSTFSLVLPVEPGVPASAAPAAAARTAVL